MYLLDCSKGKDNNLNLIRFLAAYAVLVTHSYAIIYGSGDFEPMRQSLGMTWGNIAVDIFFIVSGFLVAGSLVAKGSLLNFFVARGLRIYPALWLMLILTTTFAALFVTKYSFLEYLTHRDLWMYLLKGGTLVAGVSYELPGTFLSVPYSEVVNGSLWTLPKEVRMYILLAIVWWALRIMGRLGTNSMGIVAVGIVVFSLGFFSYFKYIGKDATNYKLAYMFFTGVAFYSYRQKIWLSGRLSFIIALLLLVSGLFFHKEIFHCFYVLSVAYLIFWCAYVPRVFRFYNRFGDYSYGIYIYAFFVQQCVIYFIPTASVFYMTLISSLVTFILAFLSWHFVEKPVLRFKDSLVSRIEGKFKFAPWFQ